MSNKYEFLPWDSDFFGFGVGRINNSIDYKELSSIAQEGKKNSIRLFYYLTLVEQDINLLNSHFRIARLVDKKVLFYKKNLIPKVYDDNKVNEYFKKAPNKDMYALAIESGMYSRFKVDPEIPNGKFEELYRIWIENSVNKKKADKVFYTGSLKKLSGIVTIEKLQHVAKIGLLSVDSKFRGQKLGSYLMYCCENYCVKNNLIRLDVYTQADNHTACSFYSSNGFEIDNIKYVYHLWI